MDNEEVGHFCQQCALCDISLLLAGITLVIRNDLSMNKLLERFFDVLIAFDFK
jgi:hypothetical protein